MNDIYLKITGKSRADGGSRMAMKVSYLIVCVVLAGTHTILSDSSSAKTTAYLAKRTYLWGVSY